MLVPNLIFVTEIIKPQFCILVPLHTELGDSLDKFFKVYLPVPVVIKYFCNQIIVKQVTNIITDTPPITLCTRGFC